jgi:predicted RNA-binding protein associated with RNAse of E/G family
VKRVDVVKRDMQQRETLRYTGELIYHSATSACVRARFAFPTRDLGYLLLKEGDLFVEWFYTDRWYNVFLICDVDDGRFKGAYCNFTLPAVITASAIYWDDLALDLWVSPTGETRLLDEEEYKALPLDAETTQAVDAAQRQLLEEIAARRPPFDVLGATCPDG